MAEHDRIEPRLDAARSALIRVLSKAGRLIDAVEELEAF